MYTMRDMTDAELTRRMQHLVPWVQDLVDQARERQTHLDALRQQREATSAGPTAVPQPPPPAPPADLQALIHQAVQQALAAPQPPGTGQAPANGTAPASPADWCPLHQVPMEQRSNAKGTWSSPYGVHATKTCVTAQGKGIVQDASTLIAPLTSRQHSQRSTVQNPIRCPPWPSALGVEQRGHPTSGMLHDALAVPWGRDGALSV